MFFMGIGPHKSAVGTQVIVLKVFLKNIKRHYEVVKIISLPFAIADTEIKPEIIRLYQDNAFMANKRIFSQDRRPTRNIRVNPRLVINGASGGSDLVKALREMKVPAECVLPRQNPGWEKETHGKALGDDYKVGVLDLLENLLMLFTQNRLIFETSEENAFSQLMAQVADAKAAYAQETAASNPVLDKIGTDHLLMQLSLPLWFREKIPYNRPYKA